MGTPEFAVASLARLVDAGCNIVGVVTAPDKPAGRGMELQQSAVKKYASEKGLTILQPEKLKSPEFIASLQSLKADLQVVVAFRMLPEIVWNMPPMGTVNVHGSLLPQYRGAAPINWAIINGETFTGVTTFKLKHDIDTGDILLQEKIEIGEYETAGELHDKMKENGAGLLLKTIMGIAKGNLIEVPQHQTSNIKQQTLLHAPKIFTETCHINWNKSAMEIFNLIRGLSPYPAAFTELENKKLKIFKAEKIITNHQAKAGSFETDGKNFLRFACIDGFINITELQLEGKKKMNTADFLRGYRFNEMPHP
ncbi:MAG: methionyl-tRNA formyltransferase [Ferruginibacter sp.]|nr:methionyl-tRNA formyltransferase [Ferruginibacter sp.]